MSQCVLCNWTWPVPFLLAGPWGGLVTEFAGVGKGKLAVWWVVVWRDPWSLPEGSQQMAASLRYPQNSGLGTLRFHCSASETNVMVSSGPPPKACITKRFFRSFVVGV